MNGAHCSVRTCCLILGGSLLPANYELGALSLLNKAHMEPWRLYFGQPARWPKEIDPDAAYFHRGTGYVV